MLLKTKNPLMIDVVAAKGGRRFSIEKRVFNPIVDGKDWSRKTNQKRSVKEDILLLWTLLHWIRYVYVYMFLLERWEWREWWSQLPSIKAPYPRVTLPPVT